MKRVLIVEDSPMVTRIIKHVMSQSDLFEPVYAEDLASAKALVEAGGESFFAAVVDLSLPDAPDGEIVDYVLSHKLPTIVLTGSFVAEKREALLGKGIVDYVTKEGRFSYVYVKNLLHRLIKNEHVKVLVVDDSLVGRKFIINLLQLHRYDVIEASNGVHAIKMLVDNPDTRLLITDYNMPRMDGFELVQNIRVKYEKTDLVIIGISAEGDGSLTAKFIKYGANDFLKKPFNHEEFFCRVTHNVELLEMMTSMKDAALRDNYTGLYNRYHFFDEGAKRFNEATEKGTSVAAAVIDMDEFNVINDQFGDDVGDIVMREISQKLMRAFGSFLIARADGQQFFALMVGLDNLKATAFVETVRKIVSSEAVTIDNMCVTATFSAGVSNRTTENLSQLISSARNCLDRAKDAGGDFVCGDDDDE